jgi:hypothetical protein
MNITPISLEEIKKIEADLAVLKLETTSETTPKKSRGRAANPLTTTIVNRFTANPQEVLTIDISTESEENITKIRQAVTGANSKLSFKLRSKSTSFTNQDGSTGRMISISAKV